MKKAIFAALCAAMVVFSFPVAVNATTICDSCLTVNADEFAVGQDIILTIEGAEPNTEIFWTLSYNGEFVLTDTGLDQFTDSNGNFVWNTGPAETSDTGSWAVSMRTGNINGLVGFTVGLNEDIEQPAVTNTPPVETFNFNVDKTEYLVGEEPILEVSAAPANSKIFATVWKDSKQVTEQFDLGVSTNSSGYWVGQYPELTCDCIGNWSIELQIGNKTAFVNFSVTGDSEHEATEGGLYKFKDSSTVYYGENNILYPFTTYYGFQLVLGQTDYDVEILDGTENEYQINPTSAEVYLDLPKSNGQMFVSGTLILDKGVVYLIMDGEKIPFANMQAFKGLGYQTKNIIKWNLNGLNLKRTNGIFTDQVPHTWGSWIKYRNTVYYSDESGMVAVPNYEIFLNNRGIDSMILPANSYDLKVLAENPDLPHLQMNDPRVEP